METTTVIPQETSAPRADQIRWVPFIDESLHPADEEALFPETVNILCLDTSELVFYVRSLQADVRALRETLQFVMAQYVYLVEQLKSARCTIKHLRDENRQLRTDLRDAQIAA